jgi:hypothetical protein
MLSDILNAAGVPVALVAIGIFLFGTYRAFAIGKVLVRGTYRNRALWSGGTMIGLVLLIIASNLPPSNPLSPLSFLVIMVVLFAFVDSSIKVAQEMDFFHRSLLGWGRLRKPAYVILIGISLVGMLGFIFAPTNSVLSGVGVLLWFSVGAGSIAYGAAALLIGARRTPDRSMQRFVRMLGMAIICMVLFFTIWLPFTPFSVTVQDLGSLISELFLPAAAYYLYLAVMSLSPVGHVEKEVISTSGPLRPGVPLPSQS